MSDRLEAVRRWRFRVEDEDGEGRYIGRNGEPDADSEWIGTDAEAARESDRRADAWENRPESGWALRVVRESVGRVPANVQLTTDKGPLPKQITALHPVRSEPAMADPSVIALIRLPVAALTLVSFGGPLDALAKDHGGTGMVRQQGEWLVFTANAILTGPKQPGKGSP